MIDLSKIRDEIDALNKVLREKQDELKAAETNNLKERYGADFRCKNCAYSCCVLSGDDHTYCDQDKCILCHEYCYEYIPENELSKYIRDNHHYDELMLDTLNDLFDIDDIMHEPELHHKALEILKLRDAKEERNDD